ncbi:site-specific tyrosine recombinase/integron integrase [uncultured Algibacter sp.]|uniref:site-specific tyrosine recombinase/integron integrase n=1 Tax=uncultured Algibacter sp. TaxID=298659 RepID=UPI00262BB25B|nr:site-specific tyrosine recombinase/integron integrase [uncultured Algibacter sp.]
MNDLPLVILDRKYHRKEHQITINFAYNSVLINILRDVPKAKWSKSLKTWYIKNNSENLKLIFKLFKGEANLNADAIFNKSMPTKQFPKRRIRDLTPENKTLLNGFYAYLKGKRYSESTVNTYSQLVADFIEFFNSVPTKSLNNRHVEQFTETIYIKRDYSISTQRQFISALKLFTNYHPDTLINNLKLERPKKSKKLPSVLSQEEIINILRLTKNLKHKAIIALLYSCGLRISELIDLELHSIDIERKQIFIRDSKGRKDRMVTLADSLIPLITNYYVSYKPKKYFVEGQIEKKYSAESVRQFLKRSCKVANISKTVTPHTLRHSYATHLLENGVDIRYIQSLLGHSRPETTMIYTHVSRKDLMNISNPLDVAIQKIKQQDNITQNVVLSRKNI